MTFTGVLKVISDISDVPRADWETLCEGRPFVSHGWLRTIAESALAPPDYRFVLLRENGNLVGAAACYLTSRSGTGAAIVRRLLGHSASLARLPGLDLLPAVVCGVGAAHGAAGLLISRALSMDRQAYVCLKLVEALESYAKQARRTLIFNNMLETEPWCAVLRERRYAGTMVPPSVVLPIEWRDFNGYLAHIKSRSTNAFKVIKREMNRCRKSGTEIRRSEIAERDTAGVYELLQAHHRYKNNEPFPFRENFLRSTEKNCADSAALYLATSDKKLVAAAYNLEHAQSGWSAFVGVDRALHARNAAYFNIAFYAPVQHAVRSGIREIVLGPGTYEAKLGRGGRLVRRHVLVRKFGSWSHRLVARAFRLHELWHLRKYAALYAHDRGLHPADELASDAG